jgi:hypothetical protein
MYREDGAMERYDVFPQANALVLVEPRVLLHSPRGNTWTSNCEIIASASYHLANVSPIPATIKDRGESLAATCAPCTPLSVMYREDGAMERYDVFPQANALVYR